MLLANPSEEDLEKLEIRDTTTLMRVTCYTWTGNKTASGVYPEESMCAARYEDIGKTAYVYDLDYNFIGEFEITDCGGAYSLQNGTSIDIYRDTLERCYEWVGEYGDYLYVKIK
jgi:hypothetical protein